VSRRQHRKGRWEIPKTLGQQPIKGGKKTIRPEMQTVKSRGEANAKPYFRQKHLSQGEGIRKWGPCLIIKVKLVGRKVKTAYSGDWGRKEETGLTGHRPDHAGGS